MNLSETELVTKAKGGCEASFAELFHENKAKVFSVVMRMVKDVEKAEDLTQDVFVQAFRKLHLFKGESAFSTWLHRIAVNITLMSFRKKKIVAVPLEPVS